MAYIDDHESFLESAPDRTNLVFNVVRLDGRVWVSPVTANSKWYEVHEDDQLWALGNELADRHELELASGAHSLLMEGALMTTEWKFGSDGDFDLWSDYLDHGSPELCLCCGKSMDPTRFDGYTPCCTSRKLDGTKYPCIGTCVYFNYGTARCDRRKARESK